MRPRINSGLVWTTSKSKTKQNFVKKNKKSTKKYVVTILGRPKFVTLQQYETLRELGMNVKIVEQ